MKKVAFVGQAMPKVKRTPHDWPSLNKWLYSIGITDDHIQQNFIYTALVDYFPGSSGGSHLVPTNEEIKQEKSRLKKTLNDFNPEVIVTIGKLSLCNCLDTKIDLLSDHIGKTFTQDPYGLLGREILIIPFPHPSGASTWKYKLEHKELLNRALTLLKDNIL